MLSTYILTEELDDDVLSLPGVRGVCSLAHPLYGYLIGVTLGKADLEDVEALCLGPRRIFWERFPAESPYDKIMHSRPKPLEPVNPDDPATWGGYRAIGLSFDVPRSKFTERATAVWTNSAVHGMWLVMYQFPRKEDMLTNAVLITSYRYDDSEELVNA